MGKANKIFTRSMAAVLSLTALLGATACGGGGGGKDDESSNKTVIKVANFGGGVREKWLTEAFDRFKVAYEDVEVTPGKKGLYLQLRSDTKVKVSGLNGQTQHMFFLQDKYSNCFTEITKGNTVDLTDIVTTPLTEYGETRSIADKIAGYEYAMQNNKKEYHMLPHYEIMSGATYDYDLFANEGLFLGTEGTKFTTDLLPDQTFYFTGDPSKKTVGNDGVRGTEDDGMPTTLNELVAQCEYMQDEHDIPAFSVAGIGAHIDYFNYLVDALWGALAGYKQKSALINQTGTVDYVTGVSSTDLWPGTGIKAPVTTPVTIADDYSNGYVATMQAGKYYAYAFVELAFQEGWVYNKYTQSGYNHQTAMEAFMMNGLGSWDKIASHVEGSYWYNECKGYSCFGDYQMETDRDYKDVRYWHMPTSWGNDVVTGESNKRAEAVTNITASTMLLNKTAFEAEGANKDKVLEVCKQFFRFLCTDAELQNFTKCTGVAKALYDYDINSSVLANLDPYQVAILNMRANGEQYPMVNQYADNNIARYQSGVVTCGASAEVFKVNFTGFNEDGGEYNSIIEAYYECNKAGKPTNAWECFQATGYSEAKWAGVLQNANK